MKRYKSIFRDQLFDGAVILVTGGGTGIGRTIAHELASLGAAVILAARRVDVLQKTRNEITQANPRAIVDAIEMNIRDDKSVYTAIKKIIDSHGRLTHIVNNAGGQFLSPAASITSKGWKAVVDTNLNGTWNVCKAAFDVFMKDNGGNIVNVIVAMQNGFPMMSHSGAARAGVENMSKSLAVEWGEYGIRINCVAPGTVIGNGMNNYPRQIHRQVIEEYQAKNPLCRLGVEGEVSSAVVYLLSPGASFVTGETIRVDGGNILWHGHRPVRSGESRVRAYTGYDVVKDALGSDLPDIFKQEYVKITTSKL